MEITIINKISKLSMIILSFSNKTRNKDKLLSKISICLISMVDNRGLIVVK